MRRCSLSCVLLVLAACTGGDGELGDHCAGNSDCSSELQCVSSTCVPKCQRAPDCGDGYACNSNGSCEAATGQVGDDCTSEVDCAAGLACELAAMTDTTGQLHASCVAETDGRPANAICDADSDCRDGTCALGHCIDLCRTTIDCAEATSCAQIPRIEANGAMFGGCLQSRGAFAWSVPVHGPAETVLLPIPDSALSVALTMSVQDVNQEVGVTHITSPTGDTLYDSTVDYFANPVRHQPALGQSVLAMPSSPDTPLVPGAYSLAIQSLKPPFVDPVGDVGTATPVVTAVIKLDSSVILDLHFYFLNFEDHPCSDAFNGTLNASVASAAMFFQNDFVGTLRTVFAHGGVALGNPTYEDLLNSPDLDGLDVSNAPSLLALGTHDVGINVFFVRSLSPVGLQAFGPGPGPAGLAMTPQSGIVIGLDSLCYLQWTDVARLTAHELARFMGLYNNVEIDPTQVDPISDSDTSSSNLMFYSQNGGTDLSPGQRDILGRSAVLR